MSEFPLYISARADDLPGVKQHLTAGNVNQKGPGVSKAKHTRDRKRFIIKLRYEKRERPHAQKPRGHVVHLRLATLLLPPPTPLSPTTCN